MLPGITIGVGNLTVGGTGKTPVTVEVATLLKRSGLRVAVLTRGYGAADGGVLVVSDGRSILTNAQKAGEEAMLLSSRLTDVAVVKGKHRDRSGSLAHRLFDTNAFVLDDSFQYDRVVKDNELLLIDVSAPFFEESLLPLGRLREPVWCARRADAVILTRADQVDSETMVRMKERISVLVPGTPVFQAALVVTDVLRLPDLESRTQEVFHGQKICCFMAVGAPVSFVKTVRGMGVADVIPLPFPDHHRYRLADLERVAAVARENGCSAVAMTEKDFSSASALLKRFVVSGAVDDSQDKSLPWYVVRVTMRIKPEEQFSKFIRSAARDHRPRNLY